MEKSRKIRIREERRNRDDKRHRKEEEKWIEKEQWWRESVLFVEVLGILSVIVEMWRIDK